MTDDSLGAADIREILRLLPHRYPFVMVDRVIDIRGDEHGIGIKNVTINEPQFLGHFPENPVMPGRPGDRGHGADGGRLCLAADWISAGKHRSMFFLTIDKAKFRKPAVPGDTLSNITSTRSRTAATCGGIAPKPKLAMP